ncbi:MAG TPA: hypothetical protein VFT66_15770 [Roseiflexaceae bacterium]|nr:hypothetical protein [Roseiflexaceae bacterium]
MSSPVKRNTHTFLIQRIKRLAPTRRERAAILGWSKEYLRKIESGLVPPAVEKLISHGVLVVPPETEEAHEENEQ